MDSEALPVLEKPYLTRVTEWLRTQRELEATGRKKKPRGRLVARQRQERTFRSLTRAWRRLSAEERQARENDFILRSEAVAWSLNLDKETERLIRKVERPANCLANKIQRLAKATTGAKLPIMLVLEETEEGRLHAHGVVILENWARDTVRSFIDLLKRAGGQIGGARQVALRRLFSAKGWRNYITKVMPRTIANLGSNSVTYTSREITCLAREDYTRELERQKAVRSRRAAARKRQSTVLTGSQISYISLTGARARRVRGAIKRPICGSRDPEIALSARRYRTERLHDLLRSRRRHSAQQRLPRFGSRPTYRDLSTSGGYDQKAKEWLEARMPRGEPPKTSQSYDRLSPTSDDLLRETYSPVALESTTTSRMIVLPHTRSRVGHPRTSSPS
ncbi:hypothetical protein [Ciceribacter azotifigens]|uniref:hypothetical protein n=1 Tax=Ciceribacter azotifigens TaxID=2069303 RepID=UPI003A84CAC7